MKTLIKRLSTICISIASTIAYSFGGIASSLKASAAVNIINSGNYVLESALDPNMVADVAWGETSDESNLWLYGRNYTDAQTFKITSVGNGYFTIQMAVTDNKVLDVSGGTGYTGCNVQIYHYNGNYSNDGQLWSFEDAGDGYVYIKSKTGYYLDVSGGYSDYKTNIQVWYGNGTDAQRWKLVPSSPESSSQSAKEDTWHIGYNWNGTTSFYLDDSVYNKDSEYSIVIDNTELNDSFVEKKFNVEPNSKYRFSAMVKCSDFLGESAYNSSGASIGKAESFDCSEYVTNDEWTRVEYNFSTGDENEIVLCLRNGMYASVCKGTAYFSNICLEKIEDNFTNQWDILAVVFKDVNAKVTMNGKTFTYTDHLYEQDIDFINYQLDNFGRSIPELSNNLMGINSIDVHIEDSPLTDLTGEWGNGLCIEPHTAEIEAILEPYLNSKDYDQIMFFAPISGVADGWGALGGTFYSEGINYCQFAYTTQKSYENQKKESFCETGLVHETLHGVETRSGWINPEKTAALHDNLIYGFTDDSDNWRSWYTAYMRSELDGGMGIDPAAYLVFKKYNLVSDKMTVKNNEIKFRTSVVDIFKDINAEHWFVPDVQFVYDRGIMVGKTKDTFDPFGLLLREEFVQALYNHIGKPYVSGTNPYPDVKEGAWYYNAVIWAKQKDIANGYGNGKFGIGDPITREQFALMLYKYAKLRGYDLTATSGKSNSYNDSSKISSWAKTAMDWAVTHGLLTISNNNLNPQGNTTRAECAHSLRKLFERYE